MSGRTIAIGDIHGCSAALAAIIAAIEPSKDETIITLGDYIDRGPDSRGVLDQLIALAARCRLIPLLGDHEDMLIDAIRDVACMKRWLTCGGTETLRSYGWNPGGPRRSLAELIPQTHQDFLASCPLYHESATHLFMHAGYVPELPMDQQPRDALLWRVTHSKTAVPHQSGKIAVVGHTRQLSGEVLDLSFLICLDTNCVRGGWLTAMDIGTGQVWQADGKGNLRPNSPALR